ncbi:ABC transporter ATP-binding protein [Pseudogracilibacillus sp. SO30301A]|uniref:ABC transporter ATP-binding protein n=1 Tax=Pseudogracilibacillus sp. SO30301A TaxID=3098291 RepID=UPI00300E32F1
MFLQIKNLSVTFNSIYGKTDVLEDVSLHVNKGEIIGIVGESGSGKSVTALSILGLLDRNAEITNGEIIYKDKNLLQLSEKEIQLLRGKEIGMIFQEPMTALNPTMKIGKQIANVIQKHQKVNKKEADRLTIAALKDVKINDPEEVAKKYPFQLSGGMRQRVVIALAMSAPPELVIADEPTTALDVTIQAEILKLMQELCEKKGTSIILITHDLGVVANICDRVYVMYGGKIVEEGNTKQVLMKSSHPYTRGLIESLPEGKSQDEALKVLHGESFNPRNRPQGCVFYSRCPIRTEKCLHEQPTIVEVNQDHKISCWEAEVYVDHQELV